MSGGVCIIISGVKNLIFDGPFDALKATRTERWTITDVTFHWESNQKFGAGDFPHDLLCQWIIIFGVSFGETKFRNRFRDCLVITVEGNLPTV